MKRNWVSFGTIIYLAVLISNKVFVALDHVVLPFQYADHNVETHIPRTTLHWDC